MSGHRRIHLLMALQRSQFSWRLAFVLSCTILILRGSAAWADRHYTIPPPRVVVATDRDVSTYDPIRLAGEVDVLAASAVYETLIKLSPAGRVEPALATSWTTSPDGTRLVFEIRKGIEFHDGSHLNAQVVAENVTRGIRAKVPLYDVVKNARAVSDFVLEMTLNRPYPSLLLELTSPLASIVSGKILESDPGTLARQPVGTGPFRLKQHSSGEFVSLQRFKQLLGKKACDRRGRLGPGC